MKTRITIATVAALAVTGIAAPALAGDGGDRGGSGVRRDLSDAVRASAKYHRVATAQDDGFVAFAIPEEVGGTLLTIGGDAITCFDSDEGGMGVHYVRNIDDHLDPADPEALVYAVDRNGRLALVALEYLIPEEFVNPSSPPVLFGQAMHPHPYLPVYILHAWIWQRNPDGLFTDFNPRVPACPTPSTDPRQ
jgi:hypothetical protein